MLHKLKRKFVLTTSAIILVLLTVILSMVCAFVGYNQHTGNVNSLQKITRSATVPGVFHNLPRDVELPYFVVYVGNYGEYLAGGYTGQDLTDEAYLSQLILEVSGKKADTGVLLGRQLMYSVKRTSGIHMIAFLDISSQNASFRALLTACVLIGLFSMALFVGLSILLAHWMVKPVERAWDQQRQFVSDASHELKTPLTVIMSNAELLQTDEYDDERKRQFSGNILTMSYQMRHLVESLLELARTDKGQVRKAFSRVNMSETVTDAVLPFEPVFFEKGITVQTDIRPDIYLTGSGQHLRQVTEILLDNAQKYSTPGVVKVSLSRQGKRCLLSVSNPGEPIPKAELSKIFGRFYRTDKARSRDGSFGLGLSIAQAVVQEHKGRIWAVSNSKGNCFNVELPCES